jgi:hypothetical protein
LPPRELLDRRLDDLRLLLLDRLLDELDFFRPPLLFGLPLLFLVSPAWRRCLFTVAAAISFARFVLRPRFLAEALMCSYCRARLLLFTPRGGMRSSPHGGSKKQTAVIRSEPPCTGR